MAQEASCNPVPQNYSFRFLDLPRELRDDIYKRLLCNFEAAPLHAVNDVVQHKPCGYYARTIHTAILLANRQIHSEAHAIMVKTNRFIHIKFFGGLPLEHMLETSTRRIICQHRDAVRAFKGYTMAVSVVPEGLTWFKPEDYYLVETANNFAEHCMILGEDCAGLVRTLSNVHMPNLGKTLDISIDVAPGFKGRLFMIRESLESFFNEIGTQENLLAPFRKSLRGVENIKIVGVDPVLAKAVQEDIAKDEWTDPQAVLADLQAAKQRGKDSFTAKELRKATLTWEEAVNEIERIHQSSSWRGLIAKGDTAFIDAVVELYFLMCLNITHVQLTGIEHPIRGYPKTHDADVYLELAEAHMGRIINARKRDWWREDYEWEPSDSQLAKLLFRQAMCEKAGSILNDDPRLMLDALRKLALAMELLPDDAVLRREAEVVEHAYTRMLMQLSPEEVVERGIFDDTDDEEFVGGIHNWDEDEDEEDDDDNYDDMPALGGGSDAEGDEYADLPDLV